MKIGFDMLLWTTKVTPEHYPIIEDLKKTGYDGVEVPIFEGTPDDYARLGRDLDAMGVERTAISIIGSPDTDPLSDDPEKRKAAVAYMTWLLDATQALGADIVAGPLHSVLGQFSGQPLTETERERGREFHREVGDIAASRGVKVALEAVNRFECYFANTMDDLGTYLDYVGHPNVKAMYDTFHSNLEEADPVEAFRRNARHFIHFHVSENDRGVPGRGHVPWAETFKAVKDSGYDGWLTIEAFGRSLPALAAATKIWRDLSETPEHVYREGYKTIREGLAAAEPKQKAAKAKRPRKQPKPKPAAKRAAPKRVVTKQSARAAKPKATTRSTSRSAKPAPRKRATPRKPAARRGPRTQGKRRR